MKLFRKLIVEMRSKEGKTTETIKFKIKLLIFYFLRVAKANWNIKETRCFLKIRLKYKLFILF